MAPGAGLAKTDIIKDVIRVMGGNTFSHLVGGDKEKSGSARLGKAADAGVLHFHLLCFALLCFALINWDTRTLLPSVCGQLAGRLFLLPAAEFEQEVIKYWRGYPVLAFEQLLRTRGERDF